MIDKEIPEINFRKDLDYGKLSHELLGFLIRNRIETEVYHKERNVVLGIEKKELTKKLNITNEELFIITSNLKEELEIDVYDVKFFGYFAKPKSVNSYISKKYLKNKRNEKRDNIRYYINLYSIIITSTIALLSITLNINQWQYQAKQEKIKIQKNKQLEQVYIRLNSLEGKTKNTENDSLKKK